MLIILINKLRLLTITKRLNNYVRLTSPWKEMGYEIVEEDFINLARNNVQIKI